jgi:hypothetical protein
MKKIYLLLSTAIVLQACSDLKQEEPQNEINYTSKIDLQKVAFSSNHWGLINVNFH